VTFAYDVYIKITDDLHQTNLKINPLFDIMPTNKKQTY